MHKVKTHRKINKIYREQQTKEMSNKHEILLTHLFHQIIQNNNRLIACIS